MHVSVAAIHLSAGDLNVAKSAALSSLRQHNTRNASLGLHLVLIKLSQKVPVMLGMLTVIQ